MGHIRNSLLKLGLCSFFPSKIGFVFHFFISRSLSFPAQTILACRSRGAATSFYQLRTFPPFAFWRVTFARWQTRGGTHPSNIGGGCAFDAKKGLDLGLPMLVTHFQQTSKKKFRFLDFWLKPLAQMIEFLTCVKKVRSWEKGIRSLGPVF